MLIYESDGFIEVEAAEIKQISRSADTVCFGDSEQAGFNVHAVLCEHGDVSQKRCAVAFHSKVLKRALIFSVQSPDNIPAFQNGEEILAELGFRLEDVNLRLSPAMLEVVLRDVPGIATPALARKLRNEKALLLSELQKDVDKDADSRTGKKAASRLASEQRLNERAEELQQILTDLLSPQEVGDGYSAAMGQVRDLTGQLEALGEALDAERQQREMSESITAAAEKRIQELEEILVDFETKSTGEVQQKQKVVTLQRHIKDLESQLESAEEVIATERESQAQFVADAKLANEQIAKLEAEHKEREKTLAETLDRLAEEERKAEQLQASFENAQSQIKGLEAERQNLSSEVSTLAEYEQTADDIKQALEEKVKSLQQEVEQKQAISDKLLAAEEKILELQADIKQMQISSKEVLADEARIQELQGQTEQKEEELSGLRDKLQQEKSLRKRLERGAADDEKRIRALEDSLKSARENSSDTSQSQECSDLIEPLKSEVDELKSQLGQERTDREKLEQELGQAHKMIDSLEKMVRETTEDGGGKGGAQAEEQKKIVKLEAKLELLAEQLEQERSRQATLAAAVADAGGNGENLNKKRPLKKNLAQGFEPDLEEGTGIGKPAKSSKPLPHELRPAPTKGALFHPDWDLDGLPCQSVEQVFKAWETVFNVQISLEGYPSQYCMAFLVVLKVKKVKKLFMLFRLKQNKHTLIKVPSKVPKNEGDLKKAIREGLKYLKTSGFEMEEMPREYIEGTLGGFFQKQ